MEYIKEPPLKSKDGSFFVLQSTALFDIIKNSSLNFLRGVHRN